MTSQTAPKSAPKPAPKVSMVKYNAAVRTARTASAKAGAATWIIGDAALSVATNYGENTLKRFADDISVELATVRNYRTMAAKFPAGDIARDLQSPTVYGIFTSQDDAFALITDGNDGNPWTVSAARELVKSRKATDGDTDGDTDGNTENATPADTDPRAKLVSEVARLAAELAKAEAALARYDAENPVTPSLPVHTVKGVPSHDSSAPRTDCPVCKQDGIVPMPAPRRSRKTPAKAA